MMNARAVGTGIVTLSLLLTAFEPVAAQEFEPIEIALWSGVQIHNQESDISGLRFSLYGVNRSMSGLDVGVVGRTTGDQQGLFYGFVGITDGDFAGWQAGYFANITKGRASGVQTGFYNQAGSGAVGQAGLVNRVADDAVGLQFGLVNTAGSFEGARLGLGHQTLWDGTCERRPEIP